MVIVCQHFEGSVFAKMETEVEIANIGKVNWLYLLYIPPINFILIYILARHVIFCILYPYQNSYNREALDRQNNERFGKELSFFLQCFLHTIKQQVSNRGDDPESILQGTSQNEDVKKMSKFASKKL